MKYRECVIVRGGGDIATGTIYRLHQAGFKVIILEIKNPTAIRRTVSFSQAIFDGEMAVEGVRSRLCANVEQIKQAHIDHVIPIVIDPEGVLIDQYKPLAVIDAVLAKKNLGTSKDMADIVIALGPGFLAGVDSHAVIETNRGHNLGRVIYNGEAEENTGIPGSIDAITWDRVVYSPDEGPINVYKDIESIVEVGDLLAEVNGNIVVSNISGLVRGMIQQGTSVFKGMKIADVDPRGSKVDCHTISDKARSIGGAVLEAILHLEMAIKE
ncbi:MAG: selenium-dependent molybdenum cofactor biosynthesis protein YqeB [Eubacteriales bacterium]|nr:selenium-dependent molybdenum cofactor biosynthesis protein YqeB [Eubacteriales bacterium]